jgi:hypothetical protein
MSPCGFEDEPCPVCRRLWRHRLHPLLGQVSGLGNRCRAGIDTRRNIAPCHGIPEPLQGPTGLTGHGAGHGINAPWPRQGARPSQELHTCHRQAAMSGSCKVESSSLGGRSRGGQRLELRMSRKEREALATTANLDLVGRYVRRNGRAMHVYADRHSLFKVNRPVTTQEALQGKDPQMQAGGALPVPTTLSLAGSIARYPMKRADVRVAAHACPRLLAGAPSRARTLDPTIKEPRNNNLINYALGRMV